MCSRLMWHRTAVDLLGTTPLWRVIRELQFTLVGVQHLPRRGEPHVAGERTGFMASGFRCSLACFARSIATGV